MTTQRDLEQQYKAETGNRKESSSIEYYQWVEEKLLSIYNAFKFGACKKKGNIVDGDN